MAEIKTERLLTANKSPGIIREFLTDVKQNKNIYVMLIPIFVFYILFHYKPMYGAIIAFKDYSPGNGIMGSPWVGLKHFREFMTGYYFWRIFRNTILISFYELIFGFPAPIILALMLNEIKNSLYKRTIQTITYMPHFISLVVICGMIKEFTGTNGVINDIFVFFGNERVNMLQKPEFFRTIFVSSGIWQQIGWGTIIYLAALSGIDAEQYEAATIDGAGRWKQLIHVTIPGIMPTIVILLILRIGQMVSVGFEKIILLYNPTIYETSDVISSYVYRKGLLEFSYSFSSAVGIFNSFINFTLVVSSNWLSKKFNETSLW